MNRTIYEAVEMLKSVRNRSSLSGSDTETLAIVIQRLEQASRWVIAYERFMLMRDKYLAVASAETEWTLKVIYTPLLERFREGERSDNLLGAMQVAGEN